MTELESVRLCAGFVSREAHDTVVLFQLCVAHSQADSRFDGRPPSHYVLELFVLLKALGATKRRLVLVGHSFGALLVRLFAAKYESMLNIQSLVLVDGASEDMFATFPELLVRMSSNVASCAGSFFGRLGLMRLLNFSGFMWWSMVSHPGSEVLKRNQVAISGLKSTSERLAWPATFQGLLLDISAMAPAIDSSAKEARKKLLSGNRRSVSVVADQSVGMLIPPQPLKFPIWIECQRKLSADLNGVTLDALSNAEFVVVESSNHVSILASPEVVDAINAAATL